MSAAAAKSLQLCPALCDPIDSSPPGSAVPGILQARTLEWVAISFSNVGKWKVKVKSLSCVRLFTTPWTAAYQAPPSMGFSRQEYWSGVPLPSLSQRTPRRHRYGRFSPRVSNEKQQWFWNSVPEVERLKLLSITEFVVICWGTQRKQIHTVLELLILKASWPTHLCCEHSLGRTWISPYFIGNKFTELEFTFSILICFPD